MMRIELVFAYVRAQYSLPLLSTIATELGALEAICVHKGRNVYIATEFASLDAFCAHGPT